jgi:hypothetical protein
MDNPTNQTSQGSGQLKTVLLTVLTLSCFAIALVELSGVSSTALFNKYGIGKGGHKHDAADKKEADERSKQAAAMTKTSIQFIDTMYKFGEITEGEIAKHSFRFRNTGTSPLLIIKAVPSCGCTVPSIPKEPIAPGAEGVIAVEFDSHNRKGHNHKNVLVYSNTIVESNAVSFEVDVK